MTLPRRQAAPLFPALPSGSWTALLLAGLGFMGGCSPSPEGAPAGDPGEGIPAFSGGIPAFSPVQPELFSAGGALVNAWADVEGDGDLDLFVGFAAGPSRLYLNRPDGFEDGAGDWGITGERGVRAGGWGDVDGDGRPDLVIGHIPGEGSVIRLLLNTGGSFSDRTEAAGLVVADGAVRQLSWVDVDSDGDLDLFVAFRDRPNALFRNENRRFSDVAPELGLDDSRRSVGAVWLDFDADGDLDLLVGNMDGDANGLFRNDGTGFTDVALETGVAWGGRAPGDATHGTVRPCAADVDGDGQQDLFFANYGPNGLFLNRGDGAFQDVSADWGVDDDSRDDSCAFGDVDHDGRLDLYVNGTVTGGVSYRDRLYRNTGVEMVEVTPPEVGALHASHGVQWADFDGDGALDLALAGTREDATHSLLRNGLSAPDGARSLRVILTDHAGVARFPGAEIRVVVPGGGRLLASRLVDSGSGYNSQGMGPVHFGLAEVGPVDLEVLLPGTPRRVLHLRNVDPGVWRGRILHLQVTDDGLQINRP